MMILYYEILYQAPFTCFKVSYSHMLLSCKIGDILEKGMKRIYELHKIQI